MREHKFKNTFQDTPNPFCSCWNKYILLCSNKYTYFFFTYPCLLIKGAPSWAQLMNDSGSSLIWYWLIFFFLVKLFSANRCQENLFKYFVVFYYIFISLTFFVYPYVFFFFFFFFETIYHSYSFSSKVCFYLFISINFLNYLFDYTQVSLKYLMHLVIVFFCSIYLYVRYSYIKKLDHNLIYQSSQFSSF